MREFHYQVGGVYLRGGVWRAPFVCEPSLSCGYSLEAGHGASSRCPLEAAANAYRELAKRVRYHKALAGEISSEAPVHHRAELLAELKAEALAGRTRRRSRQEVPA